MRKFILLLTDIEVDTDGSFKLPLDQVSALGVGLGSLPAMFRSVTTTINVPTLLQATDKAGNLLDISRLNQSAGKLIASYNEPGIGLQQARFQVVDPGTIQSVATMPYDPTMLFMAAALAPDQSEARCHPGYCQRDVRVHAPER